MMMVNIFEAKAKPSDLAARTLTASRAAVDLRRASA